MPQGLALADKYYSDYGCRARELKSQGEGIMGYLCAYVPVEMVAAAGFTPFRFRGNVHEPITEADAEMETIVCPIVRSCYDMALKGRYDFLDGIIVPHSCDSISRTYPIWKYTLALPYSHYLNIPHLTDDLALEFFKKVLVTFRESLGRFATKEISDEELSRMIGLYNRNRARMRELYELRKSSPPKISGAEITKVLVAAMSIPANEANELLNEVVDEVKQRPDTPATKSARIMVIGAQVDDTALANLIEDSGAYVVADDLCIGSRDNLPLVDVTDDPLDGIAERYLRKIYCPRSYREMTGTYPEYLELRFGHIGSSIREFKVDGVVLYVYKYCDPFSFEVPQMKSYMESMGIPVLYLEDEYSMSSISRLRTRIQAFLEMIG